MMKWGNKYGIADLDRKSIPERVKAMIAIAHPDFRDELTRQAVESGLISNSQWNKKYLQKSIKFN